MQKDGGGKMGGLVFLRLFIRALHAGKVEWR
jgi:hypothetical protein